MYTGPNITTTGLVYGYDTGIGTSTNDVATRLYPGEPTINYWSGAQYSIYNDGATNSRNQTYPPPPIPGYEVVKVTANTPGVYGQSILWNASYPNNNVATITNSVYAWLESGTFVQVGQHWFPWYYGTQKNITTGRWVRISETYTINDGGSYGTAALTYSTNGVAYFCMPQYEYKSYATPFIGANQTRSATQALIDAERVTTIDLSTVSFNSSAQPTFDGTDDNINTGINNVGNNITYEAIINSNGNVSTYNMFFGQLLPYIGHYGGYTIIFSDSIGGAQQTIYGGSISSGTYYHIVCTRSYDGSNSTNIIWVNGVQVGSGVFSGAYTGDSIYGDTINIGDGQSNNWYPFSGTVPVARIYNRALSASEISQNFQAYRRRFGI